MTLAGLVGGALRAAPVEIRRPVTAGVASIIVFALLERVLAPALDQMNISRDLLYSPVTLGLTWGGAIVVFVLTAIAVRLHLGRKLHDVLLPAPEDRVKAVAPSPAGDGDPGDGGAALAGDRRDPLARGMSRRTAMIVGWLVIAGLLAVMPYLVGPVVSRILGTVGIFMLLGLGLNIVVGYAGLLRPGLRGVLRRGGLHDGGPDRRTAGDLRRLPAPGVRREPLVLHRPAHRRGGRGPDRGPDRRAGPAAARRLPRDRHAGLRRDRARHLRLHLGAEPLRRIVGDERDHQGADPRRGVAFPGRRPALLLPRLTVLPRRHLRLLAIAGLARGARVERDARGRAGRRRDGHQHHAVQAARLRDGRRDRVARAARCSP